MTWNDLAVNWEDFRGRKGCGGGVPPPPSPRPAATRDALVRLAAVRISSMRPKPRGPPRSRGAASCGPMNSQELALCEGFPTRRPASESVGVRRR